jgi:hypothetical protein
LTCIFTKYQRNPSKSTTEKDELKTLIETSNENTQNTHQEKDEENGLENGHFLVFWYFRKRHNISTCIQPIFVG